MDLISRQAALDALTEYWHGIENRHQTLDGEMAVYVDCKVIIKRLPSAQPKIKCIANVTLTDEQVKEAFEKAKCEILAAQPEIIRCKDCKWFMKEYGWNCIEYIVCGISPTHHPIRREEDFCSRAERRTE